MSYLTNSGWENEDPATECVVFVSINRGEEAVCGGYWS